MPSFEGLTPAKEAELKENLWKIAKFEKAIKKEEEKLVTDRAQLAKSADDALAEMDAGLLQFRAKMMAKKVESEASLRQQDAEFASMAASPLAAGPEIASIETTKSQEPDAASTGSRFKMSLYSKVRPKKKPEP